MSLRANAILKDIEKKGKEQKQNDLPDPKFKRAKRTRRQPVKNIKKLFGDSLAIVDDNHNKYGRENTSRNYRTIRRLSGSHFYNPLADLDKSIQEKLKHELLSGKCDYVEATEIDHSKVKLTGIDQKRFYAMKKAKRYAYRNSFLKDISKKRFPLTERQCDAVISVVKRIEEHENLMIGEGLGN